MTAKSFTLELTGSSQTINIEAQAIQTIVVQN
ncbi:MAG: hypothetical protein ACKVJK_19360 [Methylophagaceae bacterium]